MQLKNGRQTGKPVNEDLEKVGIDPTMAAPSQPDHQMLVAQTTQSVL